MGRFYKGLSVLSGIFVWSVTILQPTDGGNITWYKPPPLETITDPTVASKTNKTLTKGSLNEELSCEFSLTADLSIITVTMMFGINTIATYASLTVLVDPRFESRGNASWIPTELKLIVFNVTETDEGLYSCKVLTASGSWIREIQVTVLDQSRITFISVNQTVDVGDLLLLNCSASGIPPPVFSWTRLSDNRTVNMPLTITGKQDEGGYRCTADNKVGNPAASDVFVTVRYKPYHVSLKISKNEVCSGTMVTFTCSAAAANPAIQNYILHINDGSGGVNIRSNQQRVFRETLFTEGRHTYRCEACNSVGCTSSRNISVDVQAPASVTIANETVVVLEGGNVTLRCGFSGFPLPNVSWNTNSLSYIVDTESILKLLNISRCSDGVHTCSASNACGNDSKNVDIDVQYPVEATGSGENAKVANGGVKVFSCPVDGNPEPNIEWYSEKSGIKILSGKHLQATESGCYTCIASNSLGTPVNITQCLIVDPNLTLAPTTTVSQQSITSAPFTTQPTRAEPEGLAGPPWAIIGAVAGGVVVLAIVVGVLTWWVHKQRKCRKDAKIHNSDLERHYDEGGYWQVPGAYAQSGPTAGNGIDSAAEQQIAEAAAPIPTYAVVDKSKKSKKQRDERPPEYAVVDKSKKKQKQESAAIPTYAAVDKSKKRKKSWEEVPPVYAEVDKSKKQKKKIDDKNLYETLDEPKKEKKPGELLYADLGDFQNAGMTRVSISPQPLLAIKKQDPYERTDYADITQFLKGDATLPPTDGNGDMEMKPERPSKKKMQGKDKETPN